MNYRKRIFAAIAVYMLVGTYFLAQESDVYVLISLLSAFMVFMGMTAGEYLALLHAEKEKRRHHLLYSREKIVHYRVIGWASAGIVIVTYLNINYLCDLVAFVV